MTAPQSIPAFTLSCAKVRGDVKNTKYENDRRIYTLADLLEAVTLDHVFRRDELERFRPSPNPQANAGKYPHSHPCPLRFSG